MGSVAASFVISMIGASGSGKSTFLRCINLLEVPDSGRVAVKGELIRMRRRRNGLPEPADRRQVDAFMEGHPGAIDSYERTGV